MHLGEGEEGHGKWLWAGSCQSTKLDGPILGIFALKVTISTNYSFYIYFFVLFAELPRSRAELLPVLHLPHVHPGDPVHPHGAQDQADQRDTAEPAQGLLPRPPRGGGRRAAAANSAATAAAAATATATAAAV